MWDSTEYKRWLAGLRKGDIIAIHTPGFDDGRNYKLDRIKKVKRNGQGYLMKSGASFDARGSEVGMQIMGSRMIEATPEVRQLVHSRKLAHNIMAALSSLSLDDLASRNPAQLQELQSCLAAIKKRR